MNDTEACIYGWKMRLMEINEIIFIMEKKREEYSKHLKFHENKLKDETKSSSNRS